MTLVSKTVNIALASICLMSISACSTTSKRVDGYNPSVYIGDLKLDKSEAPTVLYTRPSSPGLGAYNKFIIDPVRINYDDPKMKELNNSQLHEMARRLQSKMTSELREGGYEVGTRSGPDTMRVSMTIANLKAPSAIGNVSVVFVPFSLSVGEVTIEAIFRDSLSNRVDAVVINRSQGSRVLNGKPWSTWADADQSFGEWARGLRKAVDKAHNR